jgi:hypothetical protein
MDTTPFFIPIGLVRVSEKQSRKVDSTKVRRHLAALEDGDLMAIDVHALDDGTYVIAGNGRHRYFAYLAAGHSSILVQLVSRRWKDLRRIIGRFTRSFLGLFR